MPDIVQFSNPRDGVAHPARLKIGHGQAEEVPKQSGPQLHVYSIGRVRQHVGAQPPQDHIEHEKRSQADRQNFQG